MANNSTNINKITENKKEHTTLKIQILVWDRQKNVAGLNISFHNVFSLFRIDENWYKIMFF